MISRDSLTYSDFIDSKAQQGGNAGFDPLWMPEWLYPFQQHLVEWALRKGRSAIFADCGLGKTPMQLVWAENVARKTNRNVLVLTPLAVSQQLIREGAKFGIEVGLSRDGKPVGKITALNYERLHKADESDYAAVVCDDSPHVKSSAVRVDVRPLRATGEDPGPRRCRSHRVFLLRQRQRDRSARVSSATCDTVAVLVGGWPKQGRLPPAIQAALALFSSYAAAACSRHATAESGRVYETDRFRFSMTWASGSRPEAVEAERENGRHRNRPAAFSSRDDSVAELVDADNYPNARRPIRAKWFRMPSGTRSQWLNSPYPLGVRMCELAGSSPAGVIAVSSFFYVSSGCPLVLDSRKDPEAGPACRVADTRGGEVEGLPHWRVSLGYQAKWATASSARQRALMRNKNRCPFFFYAAHRENQET